MTKGMLDDTGLFNEAPPPNDYSDAPGTTKNGGANPDFPDSKEFQQATQNVLLDRLSTFNADGSGVRYGYVDARGRFQPGPPPAGRQAAVKEIETDFDRWSRLFEQDASAALFQDVKQNSIDGAPGPAQVQSYSDVADRLYDSAYERMKPSLEQENNRMLVQLQSRGIPVGSEAFTAAYQDQMDNVNRSLESLAMRAEEMAGAEQSRQFALDSAARSNAMNEANILFGGGYTPQSQELSGAATSSGYLSAIQAEMSRQAAEDQARSNRSSSTKGALGSLGAAGIIALSDRRLKTDLTEVGTVDVPGRGALRVWIYAFKDKPNKYEYGYIAQEVAEVVPEAVIKRADGYLALDYALLPPVPKPQ